jgi:hypothetical protein
MLPPKVESYLLDALEGAPDLFSYLLKDVSTDEADFRPSADRFTIREAMAHVADWEPIFRSRLLATLKEDNPTLQGIDEGEVARTGNYGARDWNKELCRFTDERRKTMTLIRGILKPDWDRLANHTEAGPITFTEQIVLISAHDAYHQQQFAQWRRIHEEG